VIEQEVKSIAEDNIARASFDQILGLAKDLAAMVVREPAQRLPSGQWVCWLRGKAGCVSCDAVTPVAP
jgi:hypothetical protein